MEAFIKKLPKAELHLHIEGSLEPELMFDLAKRNQISLKYQSVEEIRKAYQFNDLQSFLDIYYEGAKVLLQEEDFFDMAWAYLLKAKEDHIEHCEVFFDPQTHTERGVSFGTVINGLTKAFDKAKEELNISSHLIMCFLRHLSEEEAFETLRQSEAYQHQIMAVGLDSSEQGNPPSKFKNVFAKALEMGYQTVAHAGEEGPADYIWEALDLLKVSRIDHGIMSLKDPKLVEHLEKSRMPLTVCPLSNIKLRVFNTLKSHNLKDMLERNLCVTINSDDPAYFGGYLNENFIQTQKALDLTKEQIIQLAKNSFEASFLTQSQKDNFYQKINEYIII